MDTYPCEGTPLIEPIEAAFAPADGSGTIPSGRVRLAFYNIEMFNDGIKDAEKRNEELARSQARGAALIVDDMEADILLVSEIENVRAMGYLNESLKSPFPFGYVSRFGTNSGRTEKMNIGMLSRYAPASVHEIDFGPLKGQGRPTRGILRAMFDLGPEAKLLVYTTHLKSNWGNRQRNYAQRRHAMKILADDVSSMLAEHPGMSWEIILLGDMNTDPRLAEFADDPTLGVLQGWHDVWSEHPEVSKLYTVPTRFGDPAREFPPALFDRILVHPGLKEQPWKVSQPAVVPRGSETNDITVLPGQGSHVSDHFPIFIDLIK